MARVKVVDINNTSELDDHEKSCINSATKRFRDSTGIAADYCIKSPGRVNLIGDHIDYHGFSVIPMAIEKSVLVCLSISNSLPDKLVQKQRSQKNCKSSKRKSLILLNVDEETFPTYTCEHSFAHGAELDKNHEWHNYVLCGYHGALATKLLQLDSSQIYEHAKSISHDRVCGQGGDECLIDERLDGLDNMIMLIDSNLPPASGLSSSSALVCASAIATYIAIHGYEKNGGAIDFSTSIFNETLAEDCAKFEHLVGTRGGGMDQAVILTAQEGYAKHVEFMPNLRCSNVYLPRDVVWLVSHSGVSYPKAATFKFNSRVLETKLAAALILKTLKHSSTTPLDHTISLYKVKDELIGSGANARDLMTIIEEKVFGNKSELSIDEVSARLEMSRADLLSRFRTDEEFLIKTELDTKLLLLQRCRHVFEESDRVNQFKLICETTKDPESLGQLMNESHASLRNNYDCSHPALDELARVALQAGALGARLTGAGWGGCIVSLVRSDEANQVMNELQAVSKFTFRSEPQSGVSIFKVS